MITKQIAGLLYSFSYQLTDNEGNVYSIAEVHKDAMIIRNIERLKRHVKYCAEFNEIGSTYKILAREMDLTKPIEGVGVPLIELFKLAGFKWWDEEAHAYFSQMQYELGHQELTIRDTKNKMLFRYRNGSFKFLRLEPRYEDIEMANQLSLFNWLYTHHFNLDFPEGTTTNLI